MAVNRRTEIVAVADQDVEGVELDFMIVHPAMQAVEIQNTVDAEQHGLAIDHERAVSVPKRGIDDQRKPIAPVVAIPGP